MDRIRVAAPQTEITTDPAVNGRAVRHALRQAADGGARLAHLCEGALTGHAGQDNPYFDGWTVDWAPVRDEIHAVAEVAGELGIWVVIGGNHLMLPLGGGMHLPADVPHLPSRRTAGGQAKSVERLGHPGCYRFVMSRRRAPQPLPPEYQALLDRARRAAQNSTPLVPNSYLSRWAERGSIRVTRVDDQHSYTTSPGKAARETDFYRLESPDVDPNEVPPLLMEVMLGDVEGAAKTTIDHMLESRSARLDPEQTAMFAWFPGFQATRGHAYRQTQAHLANELFRLQFGQLTDEGLRQILGKRGRPADDAGVAAARQFIDELNAGTARVTEQQAAMAARSAMSAYDVGQQFLNRHWQIYTAPPILITCDEPVVLIGGPDHRRGERGGFASVGVIVFPLAPNAVLAMFRDDRRPAPPWELAHAETAELNREILGASARWAFERPTRHFTQPVSVPPAPDPAAFQELEADGRQSSGPSRRRAGPGLMHRTGQSAGGGTADNHIGLR
ncbi:DUF4238 domain-containing protein [Dactylosporangium sp. McL0621]|uniref:DUF4238 domain-containing protein n=1 Tax=Dactylosporangium sp. McL0621 TaxID=3415678 RepID=UPI003CF12E63